MKRPQHVTNQLSTKSGEYQAQQTQPLEIQTRLARLGIICKTCSKSAPEKRERLLMNGVRDAAQVWALSGHLDSDGLIVVADGQSARKSYTTVTAPNNEAATPGLL